MTTLDYIESFIFPLYMIHGGKYTVFSTQNIETITENEIKLVSSEKNDKIVSSFPVVNILENTKFKIKLKKQKFRKYAAEGKIIKQKLPKLEHNWACLDFYSNFLSKYIDSIDNQQVVQQIQADENSIERPTKTLIYILDNAWWELSDFLKLLLRYIHIGIHPDIESITNYFENYDKKKDDIQKVDIVIPSQEKLGQLKHLGLFCVDDIFNNRTFLDAFLMNIDTHFIMQYLQTDLKITFGDNENDKFSDNLPHVNFLLHHVPLPMIHFLIFFIFCYTVASNRECKRFLFQTNSWRTQMKMINNEKIDVNNFILGIEIGLEMYLGVDLSHIREVENKECRVASLISPLEYAKEYYKKEVMRFYNTKDLNSYYNNVITSDDEFIYFMQTFVENRSFVNVEGHLIKMDAYKVNKNSKVKECKTCVLAQTVTPVYTVDYIKSNIGKDILIKIDVPNVL